ncbi:MAG: ABC transporter permease [Desulforhabdus sp.]|jgi:NitT/TauT family transport system permease protein|nr:ABC transporter permease [Desulforhabdus sp.]
MWKKDKRINGTSLIPWIIPCLGMVFWIMLSTTGAVPGYLLPAPLDIGKAGYSYIFGQAGEGPYAGRFLGDLGSSSVRVACGFALAVLFGLPMGITTGRLPYIHKLFSNSINGIRAVPGISWLPLAMIWFGIGTQTTVFLVALAAFFPIYLNTTSGAAQVSQLLLQTGAMMGVGRVRGTVGILMPAAMPHIITGLRLGLGISWAYLVLGELSGVQNGLGAIIMDARMLGRTDFIIVGIIVIAITGRMTDRLLTVFLRSCFKSARRLS